MTIDKALEDALEDTIRNSGQPETVARRIIAWVRQMSQGSLVKEDDARFLKAICDELRLEGDSED